MVRQRNGRHFKSSELAHFLLKTVPEKFVGSEIRLNYFGEYDGKSEVESHFGLLSRWLKQAEREGIVKSLQDLIGIYTKYSQRSEIYKASSIEFIDFMPMPRPKEYKKMVIKDSKYMLSLALKDSRLLGSVVNKKDLSDYTILDYTEKKY